MSEPLFQLPMTPAEQIRERKIRELIEAFRLQPGWPVDEGQDRRLALSLLQSYPTRDLVADARQWREWMKQFEPRPGKGVNLRARFTRWCRNAREWSAPGRGVGAEVRAARRGAEARPARDFDDYGGQLRSW